MGRDEKGLLDVDFGVFDFIERLIALKAREKSLI